MADIKDINKKSDMKYDDYVRSLSLGFGKNSIQKMLDELEARSQGMTTYGDTNEYLIFDPDMGKYINPEFPSTARYDVKRFPKNAEDIPGLEYFAFKDRPLEDTAVMRIDELANFPRSARYNTRNALRSNYVPSEMGLGANLKGAYRPFDDSLEYVANSEAAGVHEYIHRALKKANIGLNLDREELVVRKLAGELYPDRKLTLSFDKYFDYKYGDRAPEAQAELKFKINEQAKRVKDILKERYIEDQKEKAIQGEAYDLKDFTKELQNL